MKLPTRLKGFAIGQRGFARISAVEGIRLDADSLRLFAEFDRRGLTAEERIGRVLERHARGSLHVVPRREGWAVRVEGARRATSLHATRQEALDHARQIARRSGAEVVVHERDADRTSERASANGHRR
jgi:hypothetical protein